jgi:hypothetical protein
MPLILGIMGCVLLAALLSGRREKPWPREGHGHTYFMRTTSQN